MGFAIFIKVAVTPDALKCFICKKNQKKFNGYQIRYSKNADMSGAKISKAGKSAKSKKIGKLSKKTRYYVQVRTFTKSNGSTFYSGWSGVKSVKTK